jgi:hypothetical protein
VYRIDRELELNLRKVQAKPTETWCLFLSLFAIFLREDGVSAFPQVLLSQWTLWQTHSQMAEALEPLMLLMTITEKASVLAFLAECI